MEKIEIDTIFSAGFRCHSPDLLKSFGLRKKSGPFDYMFIDLQTLFEVIGTGFEDFCSDIVVFNRDKRTCDSYYRKHNYSTDLFTELYDNPIVYMRENLSANNFVINQNYLDTAHSNNLYDWPKICIFAHHDITKKYVYDTFMRRIDRFKAANPKRTCLLYISKILTITNLEEHMDSMIQMKKDKGVSMYLIAILCCDRLESSIHFKDNVLFIVRNVGSYDAQLNYGVGTDNNLDWTGDVAVMKEYFTFT